VRAAQAAIDFTRLREKSFGEKRDYDIEVPSRRTIRRALAALYEPGKSKPSKPKK
jgi:hypothetical protein